MTEERRRCKSFEECATDDACTNGEHGYLYGAGTARVRFFLCDTFYNNNVYFDQRTKHHVSDIIELYLLTNFPKKSFIHRENIVVQ